MPQYKVTILEHTTQYRHTIIEADDEQTARELAEARETEWSTWTPGYSDADTGIDTVERTS
jgi:hypothetical protein